MPQKHPPASIAFSFTGNTLPTGALLRAVADRLQLEPVGIEPVGREAVLAVLGELLRLVEDDRVALSRPPVRVSDDLPARDQEREVMQSGLAARVGARLRLVEEQLRAERSVGAVVERPLGARLEPFA